MVMLGSIDGMARAMRVFPAPGGPVMSTLWTILRRMWSILQLGGPSVVREASLFYARGRESATRSAKLAPLRWLPGTVCSVSLDALPQLVAARLAVRGANAAFQLERALCLV